MLGELRTVTRDFVALARPYWRSEQRWSGAALLSAGAGATLALVAIAILVNQWYRLSYDALSDKNLDGFLHQLLRYAILAAAFVLLTAYQAYLRQALRIRWRGWLTRRAVARWTSDRVFYRLQLDASRTDNADQRIAEDIDKFVDMTLTLGFELLNAVAMLAAFAVILWALSGDIGSNVTGIPGHLLWAALSLALVGTWLVHRVGRSLARLNFAQQRREADFRYALVRLRENAEGIALYGGEALEARALDRNFAALAANFWSIMGRERRLSIASLTYGQAAFIFPFLFAAPHYFGSAMQVGGMFQVVAAFSVLQNSLAWFVNAYPRLAQWKATLDRLAGFEHDLAEAATVHAPATNRPDFAAGAAVVVEGVDLRLPDGTRLARDLRLTLPPGSRTLIAGPSGCGKSSLFRTLSGLWPHGGGVLQVPDGQRLLFVPQRPYTPIATLRQAAAYPEPAERFDGGTILAALADCGLGHLAAQLDEERNWSQFLSPGEQQRLAFARAFLLRPRWLFLDEATSSLDAAAEATLYRRLIERLPDCALVSIAHRSSVAAFHQAKFEFTGDGALAAA